MLRGQNWGGQIAAAVVTMAARQIGSKSINLLFRILSLEITKEIINYFSPKMVVFKISTGQTWSLRQEPSRYGSPGRAVLFHIFI